MQNISFENKRKGMLFILVSWEVCCRGKNLIAMIGSLNFCLLSFVDPWIITALNLKFGISLYLPYCVVVISSMYYGPNYMS